MQTPFEPRERKLPRGKTEPEDHFGNLIVQLGTVTEHLNRQWYEGQSGQRRQMG
jgi:hypothetical protein